MALNFFDWLSQKKEQRKKKLLIKKIQKGKFKNNKKIEYIEIPEGIKELDDECFKGCSNLKTVILPKGLKKIGIEVFKDCKSLSEIELPKEIVQIGFEAFSGCESLENLSLPKSLQSISQCSFENCKSLKKIDLPKGIKELSDYVFAGCSSLEYIKIPESVKEIYDYAFSGCESLKKIDLPKKLNYLGAAFQYCCSLEEIKIPEGVKVLEKGTFENCKSLKKVVFPKTIDIIKSFVFWGSSNLEEIKFFNYVGEFDYASFWESNLKEIYLPKYINKINSNSIYAPNAKVYFPYSLLMNMNSKESINSISNAFDSIQNNRNSEKKYSDKTLDLKKVFTVFPNLDLRNFIETEEMLDALSFVVDYMEINKKCNRLSPDFESLKKIIEDIERENKSRDYLVEKANRDKELEKKKEIIARYSENILGFKLKEDILLSTLDVGKRLGYTSDQIAKNFYRIVENQALFASKLFTYEMLAKNDKANFALSSLCDASFKLYGKDSFAQKLVEKSYSMQYLVIRDVEENIVACGLMYLNREQGYAVINRIEINKKYECDKEKIKEIYLKVKKGVQNFAQTYNSINIKNPIKVITCGVSLDYRAINDYIRENPQSALLNAPDIKKFIKTSEGDLSLSGWDKEQRIIWGENCRDR